MRPPKATEPPARTAAELESLAKRATYVGSIEHKEKRSWLGLPFPRRNPQADAADVRQNATICHLVTDAARDQATVWIQHAISHRQFDPAVWDGEFPKVIWYRDKSGNYWFGRLVQRGAGENPRAEYKGWPITQEEWHENFG